MSCRDAAERITALVDGELPPAERSALESHLEGCPACREARAAEEEVARRVRALGRPPLPGGFREAVMGRVRAATPPSAAAPRPAGRLIPLWTWMAAGTAAAAGILAMATWGGGGASRETSVASGPPPPAAAKPASALVAAEAEGEESGKRGFERSEDDGAAADRRREPQPGAEVPAPPKPSPAPVLEPAPVPAAPAPEKDAGRGDLDRENAAGPPAAPMEDKAKEGEGERRKAEEKPKEMAVPQARPRVAVFYRTLNPADAEQRVDRLLFLHRDLALEKVGWKDASEVDSTLGRLLRDDYASVGLTAGRTRDRVLQVRLRSRDLDRLRAEVGKIESMREASTLVLVDSSGRAPAEVEKAIRASLEELARKEAASEGALPVGAKTAKPDAAGGEAAREPGEPAPPPLPSKELLKRLAAGASPPRAGAPADPSKAREAEEVWVEIHVVASPPPK